MILIRLFAQNGIYCTNKEENWKIIPRIKMIYIRSKEPANNNFRTSYLFRGWIFVLQRLTSSRCDRKRNQIYSKRLRRRLVAVVGSDLIPNISKIRQIPPLLLPTPLFCEFAIELYFTELTYSNENRKFDGRRLQSFLQIDKIAHVTSIWLAQAKRGFVWSFEEIR